MDWIQWYCAIAIALSMITMMFMHDKPKEGRHDFRITFVALLISLPYYGRVFGWW